MKGRKPIGYIELASGRKPIYAMYDFFLNFTFEKKENWEDLRLIVNMLLDAYMKQNPKTIVKLIEDEIIVTTQYAYYLDFLKTPKKQDFRFDEVNIKKYTFVEMHNNAYSKPPVPIQATKYYALSISENPDKISNQIWILAEDVRELLPQGAFSNYIPVDEVSGKTYPNPSGMMFISLSKLSKEDTPVGELASFLLGRENEIKSKEVKQIKETFKKSCDEFCIDKGVQNNMSVLERYRLEGIEEGIKEGKKEGIKEGKKEGIKEGIKEGKKEGTEETKKETALTMIKKGFDALLIAEIIKMPIEWVNKIIASETLNAVDM